jgi:hypothetical protein
MMHEASPPPPPTHPRLCLVCKPTEIRTVPGPNARFSPRAKAVLSPRANRSPASYRIRHRHESVGVSRVGDWRGG